VSQYQKGKTNLDFTEARGNVFNIIDPKPISGMYEEV